MADENGGLEAFSHDMMSSSDIAPSLATQWFIVH